VLAHSAELSGGCSGEATFRLEAGCPSREFCALYETRRSPGTNARVEALQAYFGGSGSSRRGWRSACCSQTTQAACCTGRRLREIAPGASALPEWLFRELHGQVGDQVPENQSPCCCQLALPEAELLEAAAGRVDGGAAAGDRSALSSTAQAEAGASSTGRVCPPGQALLFNKLLTRWPAGWVCRTGLVDTGRWRGWRPRRAEIAQRLMGGWSASATPSAPCSPADGGGGGRRVGLSFSSGQPPDPAQLEGWGSSPLAGGSGSGTASRAV